MKKIFLIVIIAIITVSCELFSQKNGENIMKEGKKEEWSVIDNMEMYIVKIKMEIEFISLKF